MADEWKNVRTIVLTNTRITSMTSATLSSARTGPSTAVSHAGTPCGYAGALAPSGVRVAGATSACTRLLLGSGSAPRLATSLLLMPCPEDRQTLAVAKHNEKLIFMVPSD